MSVATRVFSALLTLVRNILAAFAELLRFFHLRFRSPAAVAAENPSLYFSRNEQRNTLINAGFVDVVLVIDRGDMALYRARRI